MTAQPGQREQFDEDYKAYVRPADTAVLREWVRANVVEGNQARLMGLLDLIDRDPDIWLYGSL